MKKSKSDALNQSFSRFSERWALLAGTPLAFMVAICSLLIWAFTGPVFQYSQNWQAIVNTGTNIMTFLLVFLIQNSQNRETRAVQLKLDEIIRATEGANNDMLRLEKLSDEELKNLSDQYQVLAEEARLRISSRRDTNSPILPEHKEAIALA